jgi:hypothetical protein
MLRRVLVLIALASCAGTPSHGGGRPAPHSYAVPPDVDRLVVDDAAFARFAAPLRRDLARDLPHAPDRATRKQLQFDLALFDAIAAEEPDPATRLMTGVTIRAWADAIAAGGDPTAAFRHALDARIRAMPYELVAQPLAELREIGASLTVQLGRALVRDHLGAAARTGTLSYPDASAIVFQRYAALRIAPVGPVIAEVVGAVIAEHEQP